MRRRAIRTGGCCLSFRTKRRARRKPWMAFGFLAVALLALPASGQQGLDDGVPADRLVVRYTGNHFELVSRSPVTKVLPAADELPVGRAQLRGFWYELQSLQGKIRYRRIIRDPVRLVFEGPDPLDPEGLPQRVEAEPSERVFSLLGPRCAPGDQLVLFRSSRQPSGSSAGAQQGAEEAAREVARITILPPEEN